MAASSELPKWSQERHSRISRFRTTFAYVAVRVLALVGVILIAERIYQSWTPSDTALRPVSQDAATFDSKEAASVSAPIIAEIPAPAPAPAAPTALPLDVPVAAPAEGPPVEGQVPEEHATAATISTTPKTKAIIAASMRGDNSSWIQQNFPDWQSHIFVMDDPKAPLTVTRNGGHEASAYLTYIINHYYNLPDYMVFIHAKRYQWHNDDVMYDHIPVLKALDLSHVDEVGYQSLRCAWTPGCKVEVHPKPNSEDDYFGYEAAYADAWKVFWPNVDVPKEVGAPCCAQFAVSKKQVSKRTIRDYERIRQWLWTTDVESNKSGRIMEYTWHILFGMDFVYCPVAKTCYCKAFGACNLECHGDGDCENRWWRPWITEALSDDWPAKELQGQKGWPVDGWWIKKPEAPAPAPAPVKAPAAPPVKAAPAVEAPPAKAAPPVEAPPANAAPPAKEAAAAPAPPAKPAAPVEAPPAEAPPAAAPVPPPAAAPAPAVLPAEAPPAAPAGPPPVGGPAVAPPAAAPLSPPAEPVVPGAVAAAAVVEPASDSDLKPMHVPPPDFP